MIVGAGFGGLQCALALRGEPVDVTVVNRENYHLFTPLLYQVASCLLNPAEIAAPLRKVFRGAANVHFRQGVVAGVDFDGRAVRLTDGASLSYDHLVLAAGSATNYFGNDAVAAHSLGLKNLGEALQLRNHVLETLERATRVSGAARSELLTFCIVGGGPTGVEYAGALAELARLVLPREYPELSPSDLRIVLLEGTGRLLSMFRPRLSEYARRELERRGVDVRFHQLVASADDTCVVTRDGTRIPTTTVVWTAGVRPADLTDILDVAHTPQHRIAVDDHLRVVGRPDVYAIGDSAAGARPQGERATDGVAARDARGSIRRPRDRPRQPAAVSLPRQGNARNDRAHGRGRRGGATAIHGVRGLAGVALRAPLLPHRLREPRRRTAALGVVLPAARPAGPVHDSSQPAPGRECRAATPAIRAANRGGNRRAGNGVEPRSVRF